MRHESSRYDKARMTGKSDNRSRDRSRRVGPLMLLWQYGATDGQRWWNVGLVWRG